MKTLRWWWLCLRHPELRMFSTRPAPERTLVRLRWRVTNDNWTDPTPSDDPSRPTP